jgi:hypothetical protein
MANFITSLTYNQRGELLASILLLRKAARKRVKILQFLVHYAQMKYGVGRCLGIATEPLGNGRSYDFVMSRAPLPEKLLEALRTMTDPFSSETPLF